MLRAILVSSACLWTAGLAVAEVVAVSGTYTGTASNGDDLTATAVGQFESNGTGSNWLDVTFASTPNIAPQGLGFTMAWDLFFNAGEPIEFPYIETLWSYYRGTYGRGGHQGGTLRHFWADFSSGTMAFSNQFDGVGVPEHDPLVAYTESVYSHWDTTHGWWDTGGWGEAQFAGGPLSVGGWFYPPAGLEFSFTGRLTEFDADWTSPNVLHVTWHAQIPEPTSLVLLLAGAGLLSARRSWARL